MKLKVFSLILAVIMVFGAVGCKKAPDTADTPVSSEGSDTKVEVALNPLTGLELSKDAVGKRPVAIMINNVSVAQSVQAGLTEADIVYELYAEGGITRLLAVFKDVNKIPRVGSIRSARYSHIDLALGHDAIYTHAGKNESVAVPHMIETNLDNFDLNSGKTAKYGFRISNGKASEHTLYTDGKTLANGHAALGWRTTLKGNETMWQNFVNEENAIVPNGGACTYLSVKMSGSYISNFKFDAETKKYTVLSGNTVKKDYNNGNTVAFKNILVLKTDVTPFPQDPYIVKTHLEGGEGYYVSNGGYTPIKWSKGAANNPIKITLTDGSAVSYNTGNTYVCLVDKENAVTITAE